MLISMNSRILNGVEISMGDSIIMFIDISMLVMIRLMIMNGMKIRKLILKVVFSLLVMNEVISIGNGIVFGLV